ncbi:MAG: glutaredoxin family protein [Deltaproteobacteria bacterium]|nr:glutaredoxin family protein [Deltaproteobacteria bacterium]
MLRVAALVLTSFIAFDAFAGPPEVVVFGASWCGPCQMVKSFLDLNRVPYSFLDIDQPANREAMRQTAPHARGIPVVRIERDVILGADFEAMVASLEKHGTKAQPLKPAGKEGVDVFGGQSTSWWQHQFRRVKSMRSAVEDEMRKLQSSDTVADNVELAKLDAKKAQLELLDGTFQMLDDDASRYGVPRKYRE